MNAPAARDRLSLSDKTAVITGAGSGMGRAAALLFAQRGAHVVIVDVDPEGGQGTLSEIRQLGGSGEFVAVDLSDESAVDSFLESFVADHEVVDVLYNHAGMPGPAGFDFDAASWKQCVTLNVWAPMALTQRLLPLLRRSPSASIIFTASTSGLVASPNRPLYAATKGGIILFMKSIAVMLGPEGIRANAICPGSTATPALRSYEQAGLRESLEQWLQSVPLGRLGEPEEIAHLALFLASDASTYITGAAIPVDGGYVAA